MTTLAWLGTIILFLVGLPQIWRNYARKKTDDLSVWYFILLLIASVLLLADSVFGSWQPTAVASWLVSALVAIAILVQIAYYRGRA